MTIVTLEDKTQYYVDTDSKSIAREVIDYKKKQRLDFRNIKSITVMKGVIPDKNGKYYNSANAYDGIALKAVKGWSYRWGSTEYVEQCAEFR